MSDRLGTLDALSAAAFYHAELERMGRTTREPVAQAIEGKHYTNIAAHIENAYIIKGVLAAASLVLVFGEPGSGKTFLSIDMALHVAAGHTWHGRRVRGGLVIYFAVESPASAENRIVAWRVHHRFERVPFILSSAALDMRHEAFALAIVEFVRRMEEETGERAVLLVFDTFSRAFPGGDENAQGDMSAAVAQYDYLRKMTSACVMLVHHSGKDKARGARGSTVLPAAADTIISVSRSDITGEHVAKIEKQRDGAVGTQFAFKLEVQVLGEDEDGDQVTTCVLIPTDKRAARHPLSQAEQIALAALNAGLLDKKREASVSMVQAGARPGQLVMLVEDWRELCYEAGISEGKADAKKRAFQRVRESLPAKGYVTVYGDYCWLTCEGGTK